MSDPPTTLLSLPNEMLLEVIDNLDDPPDLFSLLVANRRLSQLVHPALAKVGEEFVERAAASNSSLIHMAVRQDDTMAAKLAIKLDPNCVNEFVTYCGSPLHVAVFERFEDMVRFLLENGADPNAVNPSPVPEFQIESVLHLALSTVGEVRIFDPLLSVEHRIVLLLLEWGADPTTTIGNGRNALLHAANLGLAEIVGVLLKSGKVDVNSRDNNGSTALHLAVRNFKDTDVPEVLLKGGIDVDAVNSNGQTALFLSNTDSATEMMVKHGANVNIVDKVQRTVLHYLATRASPISAKYVRLILSSPHKVDLSLKDEYGQSALEIAQVHRNHEVEKLLEEYQ